MKKTSIQAIPPTKPKRNQTEKPYMAAVRIMDIEDAECLVVDIYERENRQQYILRIVMNEYDWINYITDDNGGEINHKVFYNENKCDYISILSRRVSRCNEPGIYTPKAELELAAKWLIAKRGYGTIGEYKDISEVVEALQSDVKYHKSEIRYQNAQERLKERCLQVSAPPEHFNT